jgi:hypothetical protein
MILICGKQDTTFYMLPEIFSQETWRGQKLALELIESQVKSKKMVLKQIDYWSNVEQKYL